MCDPPVQRDLQDVVGWSEDIFFLDSKHQEPEYASALFFLKSFWTIPLENVGRTSVRNLCAPQLGCAFGILLYCFNEECMGLSRKGHAKIVPHAIPWTPGA